MNPSDPFEENASIRSNIAELSPQSRVFIAHVHPVTGAVQSLFTHLSETSALAGEAADKIGLRNAGALIGLLHDFGKYSSKFQRYIRHVTQRKDHQGDQDKDDAAEDSDGYHPKRGDVDHSTAGAQWVYDTFRESARRETRPDGRLELIGQILSVCIASHHSGLIDILDDTPENHHALYRRLSKPDDLSHRRECELAAETGLLASARALGGAGLINECRALIRRIRDETYSADINPRHNLIQEFYQGCVTRFLFSSLIDADRISSADFEYPHQKSMRQQGKPDWSQAIERLERKLQQLNAGTSPDDSVGQLRRDISDHCFERASDPQGIYTLTVPTGGGKTLASLRYALHHAAQHGLERIVFVIPFTSIIDQNASEIMAILGNQSSGTPWVLEHHSNLEPSCYSWKTKLHTDNWDSPIIFTTMVQYLETWFGAGTRSVRRLHQLARAIVVFDEIQTLPVKTVHLFSNSLNFLAKYAKTTAILCTATQPLLHALPVPERGQILLAQPHSELMQGWRGDLTAVDTLYGLLERVSIQPDIRLGGWENEAIRDCALKQFQASQSLLIIVNTKAWAKSLYRACQQAGVESETLFHLSTNQCPAHRKHLLQHIRERLSVGLPVLCISTQLIEAGVNISFATVIRFLAGLDSIAQASGRCNRHGELRDAQGNAIKGTVLVINPAHENLDKLQDIRIGRDTSARVMAELPASRLLSPDTMARYYQYYFRERAEEMVYPVAGSSSSLLDLLADNPFNPYPAKNATRQAHEYPLLQQSFKAAASAFSVIDAPTEAILVPYTDASRDLIALLNSDPHHDPAAYFTALRAAQQYSVAVFPHVWRTLTEKAGVLTLLNEHGIYALDERYYNDEFGLDESGMGALDDLIL